MKEVYSILDQENVKEDDKIKQKIKILKGEKSTKIVTK